MGDDVRTLVVDWSGPFLLDDLRANDSRLWAGRGLYVFSTKQVIYSAIPRHNEVLDERIEYIGQTIISFAQRAAIRRDEAYGMRYAVRSVWIQFGVLRVDRALPKEDYKTLLNEAEGLLIARCQPPRNRRGRARYTGRPLRLVNAGGRGLLNAKVSSTQETAART